MPLQPPNPEFLARAPEPVVGSDTDVSAWSLPAKYAAVLLLLVAAVFGVPELLI